MALYGHTVLETRRHAPNFKVRPGTPDDRGFAARHWVEGFTNAIPKAQRDRLLNDAWSRFCYQHIEAILAAPETEVRVACPPDEESVIYGLAVLRKPSTIHCVFVRPTWRKLGIAKSLLEGVPLDKATVTTWCLDLSGHPTSWAGTKHPGLNYIPFFVLSGDAEREQRQQLRRLGAWR